MSKTLAILLLFPLSLVAQDVYKTTGGQVKFRSDAPLELIQAETKTINGAIKTSDRSFAFSIPMKTFEGFNSALQRTHFNENYLQSDKFPNATYEGKIIEEIDFSTNGTHNVRGKGKFKVHGVDQERIIRCKLTITQGKILIESNFTVMLADHDIKIPSVVAQKLAEEVFRLT